MNIGLWIILIGIGTFYGWILLDLFEQFRNTEEFKKITCPCGCKAKFYTFINKIEPSKWEITLWSNSKTNIYPLVIKRLLDGQEFRLGDTIERITARGKSYGKAVIYKIQVENSGFMQIHTYVVDTGGSAPISNDHYENADYPNLFNYIKNITRR